MTLSFNRAAAPLSVRDWPVWVPDVSYTVRKVTSLADTNTSGTLRHALAQSGNKVIVFEISGLITLTSELVVGGSGVTFVAGETAPSPGIWIKQYRTRAMSGSILSHLAFRVGDANSGSPAGGNRDNVTIGNGSTVAENVLLKNCSFAFSIDENISSDPGARNALILNCLAAYGLYNSIHDEGLHSMGSLNYGRDIWYVNNVFAHCRDRNIRWREGARGGMISNYVYGLSAGSASNTATGSASNGCSYQDTNASGKRTLLTLIANTWRLGPYSANLTKCVHGGGAASSSKVRMNLNRLLALNGSVINTDAGIVQSGQGGTIVTSGVESAPYTDLTLCGARPWDRNAIDQRVLDDIANGTGRVIDSPDDVGGFPVYAENTRSITAPADPIGKSQLLTWLAGFQA